jgi:AcrR family transcriptional regulator
MEPKTVLLNPPLQARSRDSWNRVLDAGEHILETSGYKGFTIVAVCKQANVSVDAIYTRVSGKDALFLAVYENILSKMAIGEDALDDYSELDRLPIDELVRRAVTIVAEIFLARASFVRSMVLLSGSNDAVRQHGSDWTIELSRKFVQLLERRQSEFAHEAGRRAIDACFRTVFSSIAIHIAYGSDYAIERSITDAQFVHDLCETAVRSLLCDYPAG